MFTHEELTKRKRKSDYINNATLYAEIIKYQDRAFPIMEAGGQQPILPDYIGKAIWLLCTRLGFKRNFINYTWKDEMIDDAIISCVAAVVKFKREKTNNPFGYFSKIAHNAFLIRIKEEKKQNYLKHKNQQNENVFANDRDSNTEFNSEAHYTIISEYETMRKRENANKNQEPT